MKARPTSRLGKAKEKETEFEKTSALTLHLIPGRRRHRKARHRLPGSGAPKNLARSRKREAALANSDNGCEVANAVGCDDGFGCVDSRYHDRFLSLSLSAGIDNDKQHGKHHHNDLSTITVFVAFATLQTLAAVIALLAMLK